MTKSVAVARRHWLTLPDAVVVVVFALSSFFVEVTLGLVLTPLKSQYPLVGGLVSAVPDAAIVYLGISLVPRIGAPFLFASLLLGLSSFTNSFGPPGAYKFLVIGPLLGVATEASLLPARLDPVFRRVYYVVATSIAFGASIPITYLGWLFDDIPGADQLRSQLVFFTPLYCLLGLLGAWLGLRIDRATFANHPFAQKLRGTGKDGA